MIKQSTHNWVLEPIFCEEDWIFDQDKPLREIMWDETTRTPSNNDNDTDEEDEEQSEDDDDDNDHGDDRDNETFKEDKS